MWWLTNLAKGLCPVHVHSAVCSCQMGPSLIPESRGHQWWGLVPNHVQCVYIYPLLVKLEQSGVGCYIGQAFMGAFGFADDITLLPSTKLALTKLLEICTQFSSRHSMKRNMNCSRFSVCLCRVAYYGTILHPTWIGFTSTGDYSRCNLWLTVCV